MKGPSWLATIPQFDLIRGMSFDYMHCVLLVVCRLNFACGLAYPSIAKCGTSAELSRRWIVISVVSIHLMKCRGLREALKTLSNIGRVRSVYA